MTSIADRVFLARHGQTALNAQGRLRGLSDPPLDEVGIAEATRLAAALASKHPTAVICSTLQRAVATAQAIGAASGAPVTVDVRLNDRDYGPMTGHLRDEVEREYGSVDLAPGVEPLTALAARARQAFFERAADYGPGPLVMVSHDAFNRTARTARPRAQRGPSADRVLESAQPGRRCVASGRLRPGVRLTASGICRKYPQSVASGVNPPLASRSGDEARL